MTVAHGYFAAQGLAQRPGGAQPPRLAGRAGEQPGGGPPWQPQRAAVAAVDKHLHLPPRVAVRAGRRGPRTRWPDFHPARRAGCPRQPQRALGVQREHLLVPVRCHVLVVGVGDAVAEQPRGLGLEHAPGAGLPCLGGDVGQGPLQRQRLRCLPDFSGRPSAPVARDVAAEPGRTRAVQPDRGQSRR